MGIAWICHSLPVSSLVEGIKVCSFYSIRFLQKYNRKIKKKKTITHNQSSIHSKDKQNVKYNSDDHKINRTFIQRDFSILLQT